MACALGIDLGTTNSCVSVLEGGEPTVIANSEGSRTTPSVVGFSENGEVLVGEVAKRQAVTDVDRTISSVRRHMGTDWKADIDGTAYTPQQISAFILQKLKKNAEAYLGEPVADAAITVPAYFNDTQRQATKDTGQIARLNIQHIVNEPTAAALTYGLEKGKGDELVLVFDFGGGASDVSLLEVGKDDDGFSTIQARATSGDNKLGGDDRDERIVNWLVGQVKVSSDADLSKDKIALQRLKEAAEKAKRELSSTTSTNVSLPYVSMSESGPIHIDGTSTRAKFEEITKNLLECTKEPFHNIVRGTGIKVSDTDHVVLVGGSTRMPAAVNAAKEPTGGKEPGKGVNPDEVVVVGTALQAGVISGDRKGVLLIDATPLSLGIETSLGGTSGIMTKLIEHDTAIPTKRNETFSTTTDNQPPVTIQVFQNERELTRDNKLFGTFDPTGIVPTPRGVPQIEVTFDIDVNGIVYVSVHDKATSKEQSMTIIGGSVLPKEETECMVKGAEEHAAENARRREEAEVHNQAEQTVYSIEQLLKDNADRVPDNVASDVRGAIEKVREVLKGEDLDAASSALSELNEKSQEIDKAMYTSQQADAGASADAFSAGAQTGDKEVVDAEIVGDEEKK